MLIPLFQEFQALVIISFILGLGLGCGQPISLSMAYTASPTGRTGEVLGFRLTINKTVQFLVPIIFGSLGAVIGFFSIFLSSVVLLCAGSVYILLSRLRKF